MVGWAAAPPSFFAGSNTAVPRWRAGGHPRDLRAGDPLRWLDWINSREVQSTWSPLTAPPFPDAVSPKFEVNVARLERTAQGRFNLGDQRHAGQWYELFAGLTLDECLKSIRDDPGSQP